MDFAALRRSSVSFFDSRRSETASSRWARAMTRAAKVQFLFLVVEVTVLGTSNVLTFYLVYLKFQVFGPKVYFLTKMLTHCFLLFFFCLFDHIKMGDLVRFCSNALFNFKRKKWLFSSIFWKNPT